METNQSSGAGVVYKASLKQKRNKNIDSGRQLVKWRTHGQYVQPQEQIDGSDHFVRGCMFCGGYRWSAGGCATTDPGCGRT